MNKVFYLRNFSRLLCLLIVVLASFLQSCDKENDDPIVNNTKDFGQFELTQPEILNVTEKGISLQFNFKSCGGMPVEEYGLVWYNAEDSVLLNNCVKSIAGKPSGEDNVRFELNSCLPEYSTIYIRAYIKVQGQIRYSQFVSAKSKGCVAPVIGRLLPEHPLASQQIKIEGANFARTNNASYLRVSVNDFQVNPDSVTEDGIYLTLPGEYFESYHFSYEMTLKIILFGKEFSFDKKWTLANPWRNIQMSDNFPYSFSFGNGTATSFNNTGYVLFENQNNIYSYDASANSWSVSEMPFYVGKINFCFNANNKIYIFSQGVLYSRSVDGGDWTRTTSYPSKYPEKNRPFFYFRDNWLYIGFFERYVSVNGEENIREFRRYHIEENRWEKLTPIPDDGAGIYSHFIFNFDNKIHVGTSRSNGPWDFSSNRRIWSYSPLKDMWSWDFEGEYSDFPSIQDERALTSFTDGHSIFIGFGESMDHPYYCSNYVWKLDVQTRKWNMMPRCPQNMELTAWFAIGTKIYILGTDQDHVKKYFYELDTTKI